MPLTLDALAASYPPAEAAGLHRALEWIQTCRDFPSDRPDPLAVARNLWQLHADATTLQVALLADAGPQRAAVEAGAEPGVAGRLFRLCRSRGKAIC